MLWSFFTQSHAVRMILTAVAVLLAVAGCTAAFRHISAQREACIASGENFYFRDHCFNKESGAMVDDVVWP